MSKASQGEKERLHFVSLTVRRGIIINTPFDEEILMDARSGHDVCMCVVRIEVLCRSDSAGRL